MSLTIAVGEKEEKKPTHVDEFIDYGTDILSEKRAENEDYARWVLLHFRLPAITKMALDKFMGGNLLFCTYEDKRYRVTGASRLGDVWLATDFNRDTGYDKRVCVDSCVDWGKSA